MTAPTQAMEALQQANDIRSEWAALRRKIAALGARHGAEYAADVVEHDYEHPVIGRMRIVPLLTAVHRVGRQRAEACMRLASVRTNRRLSELSPRQRKMIADQLYLWASVVSE